VGDEDLAAVQLGDVAGLGDGDVEDDVGAPGGVGGADRGPGLLVGGVGVAGGLAGPRLDDDVDVLVLRQRFDDVGDQRDTALPSSGLLRHSDLHGAARKIMRSGREGVPTPADQA
jgi:hypothetical protein